MEPIHYAWLAAIVSSSAVTKVLAVIVKKRDLGLVMGPAVGVLGGVALWQGAIQLGLLDALDPVAAGGAGAAGGFVAYVAGVLVRGKSA